MSVQQHVEQSSPLAPTVLAHVAPEIAGPETSGPFPDEQVDHIVERLQRRYADRQISRTDIERSVRQFSHRFENARIRTFANVFVERLVRKSIDEQAGDRRAAAA